MIKRLIACGILVLAIAALSGCGDDPPDGEQGPNAVLLRPERFPSLYEGLVYEGWMVNIDEDSNWVESVSLGKFFWDEYEFRFLTPDVAKAVKDSIFMIPGTNPNAYDWDMIGITLEEYPTDGSTEPSATIVAQSTIIRDVSTFMRFPVNFDGIPSGTFVIATFSNGFWFSLGEANAATERFGLWFLNLTPGSASFPANELFDVGMTLPVLPDTGYLYEGWVALNGGDTVSTGKFYYPDYQDYNNEHCDDRSYPNFPGEDFLKNRPDWIPESRWPLDVTRGGVAFVTVEPNPDNDLRRPSNLVVLRGNLPQNVESPYIAMRRTNYPIGSVAGVTFPKIEAVFVRR